MNIGYPMLFRFANPARFYDADNSHYAGFSAASVTTSSVNYSWPAAGPGVSGYVLSCDTSGNMSWAVNGGGAAVADNTGTIGLTRVQGSAATALRSDGSQPLSQAITPTWSGAHIFDAAMTNKAGAGSGYVRVGGNLYVDSADRDDNIGGGTGVDLSSYTMPANTLNAAGDTLKITTTGRHFGRTLTQLIQFSLCGTAVLSNSFLYVTDIYWQMECLVVVKTAGASGVLKYALRFWEFSASNAPSLTIFSDGEVSCDLTASQVIKMRNTTTGTGATPYATEYLFINDFISKGS